MPILSAAGTANEALTSAITTAAADMEASIGAVLPAALGVATVVLVITVGWRVFKKISKG